MKNIELIDVTKEFLSKATPGEGSINYENGFNPKYGQEEKLTAFWLLDTFGGDIILLKQNSSYMIKNPDYKWNDKFWELKNIETNISLDHALRKALKQIMDNPGGIIINISNYKDKQSGINGIIKRRISMYAKKHGYIIIKNKNKLFNIYKY